MLFTANLAVQAICRTLFHSLWQGLLLAVAAGMVVLFTKKLRAAVRYNILTTLLAVFTVGVACTFCYQLSSIKSNTATMAATVFDAGILKANTTEAPVLMQARPQGISAMFNNWLTYNANFIVLGWLLVIAFRCVQMFMGLRGIYILRHKGLTPAGDEWNKRLAQLAASIQVSKPVRLMQSAIAKVPMITGHLKPVILLPAGVLTALPPNEIEAILLHELAHIRRRDYLVNMLQNICGMVFFFNPAVLWVSSLIKEERENCCDDIALAEVKNKKQFIHALISFQEYTLATSSYVVGFPGRKEHLLNRVKRIVTNNNKTLNNMEKTLLATGIVILAFITFAFANAKQAHTPAKKAAVNTGVTTDEAATPDIYEDTTKKANAKVREYLVKDDGKGKHFTVTTDYEGKKYRLTEDNDTITTLYVDDVKIPRDKIASYKPVLDNIMAQLDEQQKAFTVQQDQFREQQEEFNRQQQKFREQEEEFRKQSDTLRNGPLREKEEQFRRQEKIFRKQEEMFRQQQRKFMKDQKRYADSGTAWMAPPVAPVPPAPPAPLEPTEIAPPAPPTPLQVTMPPAPPAPPAPPSDKAIKALVSELKAMKIISSEKDFSFSLNSKGLVVNGVAQPQEVFEKIKNKYLKGKDDYISYDAEGMHIHTHVSISSK